MSHSSAPANNETGLDCLAIGAHPDDIELFCGGTLALAAKRGKRVGIVDLTRGERGTRGTPETRRAEAEAAAKALGVSLRRTLDLGDGDMENTLERRRTLVGVLRELRPRLVITHWPDERHPDHRRAYELVKDCAFLSNVGGFDLGDGKPVERWLIGGVAFGLGYPMQPDPRADWVVDVTEVFEAKMNAVRAFGTQFLAADNDPKSATYLASKGFWQRLEHRSSYWGHLIGGEQGEPFLLDRPVHAGHPLVQLIGGAP